MAKRCDVAIGATLSANYCCEATEIKNHLITQMPINKTIQKSNVNSVDTAMLKLNF